MPAHSELAPKVKADLAYFDPPYATHFSTTNYEKSYHFLEGLMTYWKDKEINKNNKARNYITDSTTVTQANANEFFTDFLSKSKHIKYWLISYRDHAYPSESELKKIVSTQGKDSRMKSKDHSYSITSKRGDASNAKERLFICTPTSNAKAEVDNDWDGLYAEAMQAEAIWEETANKIRYRVRDPQDFIPESFRQKKLAGVEGVSIIIAKLKPEKVPEGGNSESMVIQAYRFARKAKDNPDGWTMEKAKEWIEKHEQKKADLGNIEDDELSAWGNMEEIAQLSLDDEFDPDLLSSIAGKTNNVRVTGYIGSKHFIMNWIDKQVPKGIKSFFDAFSGGSNVAYFYKRKGLQVFANDL